MDRRRTAGLLLALAACIATATAAPTATNHTAALDLYDGAPDGCYYNFQHYGEGDRIMTNEPCLNCTCHNRMLMCYLRVCPFTKPIGQDCTIEKRADQCCPIVTCPDVPVDLLTSTTTSTAEYGSTGIGQLDKFGCSINGKYFSEGSKVPPTPNKPCEHCYCIRNMTTCVMQECTLHVDGCTPIYHKDVCCPVRYSCDHPEDEMPLLDDLSTTVRPTPGFLLTTTTISPVTQMSQDCVYDNRVFPDGALIKTEKACDHCYCMKGDIVCVVQECGTPMENEGKNCTALQPREGVCCPDTYICEGDESITGTYETYDFTTHAVQEKLTTLIPPRRTSSEGSGYRNDDEVPYTGMPVFEQEIEGSGEDELKHPPEITTDSPTPKSTDDILASTEEAHEYISLTTAKPTEEEIITAEVGKDEFMTSSKESEKTSESQPNLATTTGAYIIKEAEESVTDKTQEDTGSGELPEDISLRPQKETSVTPGLSFIDENISTTEINKQNTVTLGVTERESQILITTVSIDKDEKLNKPIELDIVTSDVDDKTTSKLPTDVTNAVPTPASEESNKQTVEPIESSAITDSESPSLLTTTMPLTENEITESAELHIASVNEDLSSVTTLEPQNYPSSTSVSGLNDEFITTESQEHDVATETVKETEYFEPQKHTTASTPMLEEIEKDTTEFTDPERVVPSGAAQDDKFSILSTTISNDLFAETNEKNVTLSTVDENHIISEDYIPSTTSILVYDQQEITTAEPVNIPEFSTEKNIKESSEFEQNSPLTTTPTLDDNRRRTTQFDSITYSENDSKHHNFSSSTAAVALESEEVTTEPDKGLNTIPSDLVEDVPVSLDVQKTTVTEEEITTESGLDTRFDSSTDSVIIPSKPSTIPDTVDKEQLSTLTTESTFEKENHSTTSNVGPELTTVALEVTEKVDHTKSTESVLDLQHEIVTSPTPKYPESIEETTLSQETSNSPNYESSTSKASVSEKDLDLESEIKTSTPPQDKPSPTTIANQEENEIFNEPRIPGEGDCLLNGITYTNESTVPSTNKCQSGCKCISSIIKCDPIICSPPPEYMNNCETMYDTPNACCPTYICDHKTETIPPQSHNQMSGTEAPVISAVQCHGDECEFNEDKKHHEESCKSGSCVTSSNESKETVTNLPNENVTEQPISDQKEKCTGDKCTPILCTSENGCQASPVIPCEGEKCEITHDIISPPQQCAEGENCAVSNISTAECSTGNCDASDTQSEDIYPKETCTEKEGCLNIPKGSEQECKEDSCKRKDNTPLDHEVPTKCTEPNCDQPQKEIATSTELASEKPSQEIMGEDDDKETTKIIETTENIVTEPSPDTHSHETVGIVEPNEIVTKQPELISSETISTIKDNIALVTKFESEATTQISEVSYEQKVTSGEFVPENNKTELPVLTETTTKDFKDKVPSSNEITTEMPYVSITHEYAVNTDEQEIKTESPQEFITRETPIHDITYHESTSTKTLEDSSTEQAYTFEIQKITDTDDKVKPEDATHVILEESSTEPSKTYTLQSDKITKPLIETENKETSTEIAKESSIEPLTIQDNIKLPEIIENAGTSITFGQESSTEPAKIYTTESQEITEASKIIDQDEITTKATVENITEPTKSVDIIKDKEYTIGIPETSRTEATKIVDFEEQVGITDHPGSASKPTEDISTETYTTSIDLQRVTVTSGNIEQYSSTVTIAEEIDHEPPKSISTEPQEVPESTETPSVNTEETRTEPSKTISTESLENTESHLESDLGVTTAKISLIPSSEPSISYTMDPYETKSPQDLDHKDVTQKTTHDSVTILPERYSTKYELSSQSPEKIEHEETTITVTSTEQSIATEQKSPEEIYHDDTTTKILEELITSPPRIDTVEQEITISGEEMDHKYTTSEEPPNIFITNPQNASESSSEIDHNDTRPTISENSETEPSKVYSTQQEVTEAPKIDHDETTMNILEESATEPPLSFETEPQGVSKPSEDVIDEENTTPKVSQATELHATEAENISKPSEVLVDTTTKTIAESTTEISITPERTETQPGVEFEWPGQFVTESNIEIESLKPTIIEMSTKGPRDDEEKSSRGPEILETITTAHEPLISESDEFSTPSIIILTDPKVTTPQEVHKETTALFDSEPQTEVDSETEPSLKEQMSTISVSTEHDIAITITPVISDSEKLHVETTPKEQETEKPESEMPMTTGLTDQPDLQETLSTQQTAKAPVSENDIPKPVDIEVKVPAFIPTEELKTTSSEIQDLTTSKPTEVSQTPHDTETKTEYLDNTPQEHDAEAYTEQILENTEKPVSEKTKTTKPLAVTEADITKETEPPTVISQINSDLKPTIQEENDTEDYFNKYSSPQPTIEYDSTKAHPDEDTSTIEYMFQESKEPEKPVNDLILSLVTNEYEISTKPSYLEKVSQTDISIQISSTTPESDITQPSEQDDFKEKLTTLSIELPDTTLSQSDDKLLTSTEYTKPVIEDETRTQLPPDVDKPATESTTQKEHFSDESGITQKPSSPQQNYTVTSTISEHRFTTKNPDTILSTEIATETIVVDTFLIDKQESGPTEKPSVDILEPFTESIHTTEASETMVTKVDQTTGQDQEHTEPGQQFTDVQTQEKTEPSKTVPADSPAVPIGIDTPTSGPDNQSSISTEQITTEGSDFTRRQPELTTLNPGIETESSEIESTTGPKPEYPESTSSSPVEDGGYTDKIKDDNAITSKDEEFTTEVTKVAENSNALHSSEVQPESTQTAGPIEPPIKELTTKKELEPEIYQTTLSGINYINEKTTPPPVSSDEESTTLAHEISPTDEHTEEQSIPVVISDTEKTSTPKELIAAPTERVIPASEKPLQETTAPEEEFILATSKATTAKTEEEISTMSPFADKTTRPTDAPAELPITTMPEAPITAVPETLITMDVTMVPEAPIMTASEAFVTSPPEILATKIPGTHTTTIPEVFVTKAPEVHETAEPEVPVTKAPELPFTNAPEPPVTTAPELLKPVSTEVQPTDEVPTPDEEGSFSPSGGSTGYGPEPEYEEEDQTFGPGTCRYGGKVYVSAQQIPRDDPCDFCFCFRSDIICLQQSCPPPIHGCHEEPIQGFCCPRYECPVSMATTVNVTTTTTTTTTTLPPHFPTHSYKGSVQKRGCQIKGQTYKVGEVVRASSGPCLHCTCGGDGQMKCDPKVCTPEPMLRQMIAAAVSAKRRR